MGFAPAGVGMEGQRCYRPLQGVRRRQAACDVSSVTAGDTPAPRPAMDRM